MIYIDNRDLIEVSSKYIGEKFGSLTVLGALRDKKKRRTYFRCLCDCGKETVKFSGHVQDGHTKSCGCLRYAPSNQRKDYSGTKFGHLLAIEPIYEDGKSRYKCRCDCGEETIVYLSALLNGQQMCGKCKANLTSQLNRRDYTGLVSKSGVLFLYPTYSKDYSWYWRCKCGYCGSEFDACGTLVWIGQIKSCGCIKSANEEYIKSILEDNQISYKREVTFDECVCISKLRFDFGIYFDDELLGLIEYDGEQHYIPIEHWGGKETLDETKKRDQIKDDYCKNNSIPLLRIPYYESKDNIESIVLSFCHDLFIRNDCPGIHGNMSSPATPYSVSGMRDKIQSELAQ